LFPSIVIGGIGEILGFVPGDLVTISALKTMLLGGRHALGLPGIFTTKLPS
jgi:hypothetical protein